MAQNWQTRSYYTHHLVLTVSLTFIKRCQHVQYAAAGEGKQTPVELQKMFHINCADAWKLDASARQRQSSAAYFESDNSIYFFFAANDFTDDTETSETHQAGKRVYTQSS